MAREWTPPSQPVIEPRVRRQPSAHMYAPLVYAPILPMIRIGLRGRLPQHRIDQIFLTAVGTALAHAGYIMFGDSSV